MIHQLLVSPDDNFEKRSLLECLQILLMRRELKAGLIQDLHMDWGGGAMAPPSHYVNPPLVVGTYGYAAPEYMMTGHLTARSDVYGFGVVLLEMLLGRRAVDKSRPNRQQNLVEWARPLLIHNRKLLKILDSRLEGQYSNRVATEVASLAYRCLSQNPKGRPAMNEVVETLENIQNLPESREDFLFQYSDCAVTLYEVPKEAPSDNNLEKNDATVNGANELSVHHSERNKFGNCRSNSEPPPPLEYNQYSPSPESDRHQPL